MSHSFPVSMSSRWFGVEGVKQQPCSCDDAILPPWISAYCRHRLGFGETFILHVHVIVQPALLKCLPIQRPGLAVGLGGVSLQFSIIYVFKVVLVYGCLV